jgi:hypothetical protein
MPGAIGILAALLAVPPPLVQAPPPAPGFLNGVCTESPHVTERPPDDPGASSFASPGATWFANDSRTLWAWWWGKTSGGDYKVLWVRPGLALTVTGRRLDGAGPPMTADILSGYYDSYQASGLNFPAPGCWQVEAIASGRTLRFVVRIQ